MKRVAALGLLALSGCPYDASAAGFTNVDGGVAFAYGDGGTFFLPTGGSNSIRPLRAMPSQETLCMLYIGDMSNKTDFPAGLGTWIDDVRAPWLLGEPSQQGEFQGANDVQIGYTYRDPKSNDPTGMDTVSISLNFEYVDTVDAKSVGDSDGHWKGTRWFHPYFLSGVTAQGFDYLACWDWRVRENAATHWTACPNCINGMQVQACAWLEDYDHVDQCYR